MNKKILTAIAVAGCLCMSVQAVVIYENDFESATAGDALGAEWTWGVENYEADHTTFVGNYFPGGPANPGIYAISTGQSGIPQGVNVLKAYGDYGYAPNFDNNKYLDTLMYVSHTITAGEAAEGALSFTFDYKAWPIEEGGLDGASTADVFLKVLSSDYLTTYDFLRYNVTSADSTWGTGSLEVADISAYEGRILQFGTIVGSQNYSPTAIAVDNLNVEAIPEPATFGLLGAFGAAVIYVRRRCHG